MCDAAAVQAAFGPGDLVVHAAAMTDVDGCERDEAGAFAANADAAGHVAETGARVIQLSTDYVFDGRSDARLRRGRPDRPDRRSTAVRSSRASVAVLARPGNLVVRTSWVYGDGRNFFRAILAAERAGRALRVVDDQRGRPTAAADLARALAHLAALDVSGIVHVTGDGEPCTWADLAEIAVGHPVERITTEEFGAPAPRPRSSVLALDRARALGVPLADWRRLGETLSGGRAVKGVVLAGGLGTRAWAR